MKGYEIRQGKLAIMALDKAEALEAVEELLEGESEDDIRVSVVRLAHAHAFKPMLGGPSVYNEAVVH